MVSLSIPDDLAAGVADWRDRICTTFVDLDCEDVDREHFFGAVSSRQCDDLRFSRVHSTRQRVVRSQARLARSASDDFLLSLQTQGTGRVRQGNREALQQPGDMVLYDTSRPYELTFDGDFRQLILTMPRAQLLRAIPGAEDLTAVAISGDNATAKLAASYVSALAKQCTEIAPAARRTANGSVFDLLAMSFSTAEHIRSTSRAGAALFNRAIAYIDDFLVDPDLSPSSIAAALGVSLRYLSLVFAQKEQSVSRTIWNRRLHRAARDLANPALASTSITSIAFSLGFNDSAHFTRAFKSVHGETPSGYRTARRSIS